MHYENIDKLNEKIDFKVTKKHVTKLKDNGAAITVALKVCE